MTICVCLTDTSTAWGQLAVQVWVEHVVGSLVRAAVAAVADDAPAKYAETLIASRPDAHKKALRAVRTCGIEAF